MDLADQTFASGRDKLSLLLEATSLLHSQLPLEAVLHAMLDRAITITNADRGLLMEVSAAGALRPWLARRKGSNVPAEEFAPSQTAVDKALKQQSAVVTEDVNKSGGIFDSAQSIIAQRLRTVVAMPLYAMPRANTDASILRARRGEFLGLLYLDSQRPAAFSMSAVRGNGRGGQRELSYRNSVESAPGGD
jgi:GAF domain-containing protein